MRQVLNSPWISLAQLVYGRRHAVNRRRLYNAWRGRQGVSALRQRVLRILGVDEDGNTVDACQGECVSLCCQKCTVL